MRRKVAPEPAPESGGSGDEEFPDRVLWAGRERTVLAELREAGLVDDATVGSPYWRVRRRQHADARAWCAARGISAQRSVFGCREPSAEEVAAGTTRGAGPHWQRRLDREAEGR